MEKCGVDISKLTERADRAADSGEIPLYASADGRALGIITVSDPIKPTSKEAIDSLKAMKIKTVMLTGDNKKTAEVIRSRLGIDEVYAELMPEDKSRIIRDLQSGGLKTAMIGDGINDAPALTAADVGIAIGAGQDIAVESADIVLMKSDLRDAVTAVKLSRSVIRNIRQNLFWALIYNTIGIPLAAGVFYPIFAWKLNPMFAAAAMSLSSVCVVTNALRLNFFKANTENSGEIPQVSDKNKSADTEVNKLKRVMKIEGMMCGHCTGTVSKVLNAIDGVSAEVSLEDKCAYIELSANVSDDVLREAVVGAGYEVISIE
jgi:Cu+-exporting ATPase